MARDENIGIRRLLGSIYGGVHVLLVIHYIRLLYHKLFPKMHYDYDHASQYILAYFPPGSPGMSLFTTTMTNKKMLAWFEKARATMQAYLINGTMRVVTDEVPKLEIDDKCSGHIIAMRMISDGIRGSKSAFAQAIADLFIEAKELASNG